MRQTKRDETGSVTAHTALDGAGHWRERWRSRTSIRSSKRLPRRFEDDAEAQKLFRSYQNAQRETQMIRGWGGRDKGFEDRFQRLKKALFAHPTCKRYLASQESLLVALKDLNDYLTGKLGFDFADMTKPAGGCC